MSKFIKCLRRRWARRSPLSPEVIDLIVEQARFTLSYKSPRVALAEYLEKERWPR